MFRVMLFPFLISSLLAASATAQEKQPLSDLERKLLEQLSEPAAAAGGNPISQIADDMSNVVGDLAKLTTGKPTQQKQEQIIKKLDDLIAQLEQECEACRKAGTSGSNPTRPLADSVIVGGPGGIGSLHAPRPDGKKWGDLPPRERDRILQSQSEGFPPHYQRILERYFRRVAEEQPAVQPEKNGSQP
jgi:hypothetical protein